VRHLFDATIERHGRLDVAVHNAGLGGTVELVDMTDEQWMRVLDVTLNGTFRCTRAASATSWPSAAGALSTTHRSSAGVHSAARRITPRRRQASWP